MSDSVNTDDVLPPSGSLVRTVASVAPSSGTPSPIPQLPGVMAAIRGQEGSGPNSVSPRGAYGTMQVTKPFFDTYAQPGEEFSNELDRQHVAQRGILYLNRKYNGDQARVAVAYFSGESNVSPPGSPVPWINNTNDGHTTVAQYVNGVMARTGKPTMYPNVPGTSTAATAPEPTESPEAGPLADVQRRLRDAPQDTAATQQQPQQQLSLNTPQGGAPQQAAAPKLWTWQRPQLPAPTSYVKPNMQLDARLSALLERVRNPQADSNNG